MNFYLEVVSLGYLIGLLNFLRNNFIFHQSIPGVPKIKVNYNPATWMLEVTSAGTEANLRVNFTNVYRNSELYRLNSYLTLHFNDGLNNLNMSLMHSSVQEKQTIDTGAK